MSQAASQHRADAPHVLRCAVLTVSDTRTIETDTSGQAIVDRLMAAGHEIAARRLVKDEPTQVRQAITDLAADAATHAILVTGGTGISARDRTFETIAELLTRTLPGYGELFRWLSYQEIGPAAMLSRAIGGLCGQTVVLSMPGSMAAVHLAMEKLIVPELPHLVREARR
ncbi:MAG TPA: molybdenum cofactor biosynthesis protein B [Pirellulales bacterium]|jgi:molybdenum cofactor biosynthesis protein B|nr:molybdenum cofactor biosynthesis protein B [Pirellulales bacterium]